MSHIQSDYPSGIEQQKRSVVKSSISRCLSSSEFNNIRHAGVLEDLIMNLSYIPVDEIESLVEKHKVL